MSRLSAHGSSRSNGRIREIHRCSECGWQTAKWVGRCGECQSWGTITDTAAPATREVRPGPVTVPAVPITEVTGSEAAAESTGLGELDRVLGGGLVAGSVILLSGEPGVGKSTLLLDLASRMANRSPVLYVTGEESAAQVRLRAERIGALQSNLLLTAESNLATVLGHIEQAQPALVIVDSVQTISTPTVEGVVGGVSQIREVATALIAIAKRSAAVMILVGHVTKDGGVAGPRTLEHLVDVVLSIEGDRQTRLRLVRAAKNRYGPADEVGCFELSEAGIRELVDPSELFLSSGVGSRENPIPGTCVTVVMEGSRPLVAEVQALIDPTSPGTSRRITNGLVPARVAMALAVLERRVGIGLKSHDAYVSTVGGMRISEPAADLAVVVAATTALSGRSMTTPAVAIGEVGLAGDVRQVTGVPQRLAQAARLGFTHAIVPAGSASATSGMVVTEVSTLNEALAAVIQIPLDRPVVLS